MGNKKKRGRPDLDELLARPWCYYCERDFDDLKILIDHQRAKHFKCDRCGRRLNTAGGLSVHLNQVHKETLTTIENALPNRSNLDVEIFGTEGIPPDVVDAHRQRVLTQYAQAEAERRAVTGNPPPGASGGESAAKKPKLESKEDIKARMAAFKAKKAAGQQGASSVSSPSTPGPSELQHTAPPPQAPGVIPPQQYGAFPPQPYGASTPGFPPPNAFSPPQGMPAFSSPPGAPFAQAFSPTQAYPNPMAGNYGVPGQFPGGPAPGGFPGGPPPYGVQSPPMPYGQQTQFQPPSANPPPQVGAAFAGGPPRNGAMSPTGLPQRPLSGVPPVNPVTMQQMHQGQYNPQKGAYNRPANDSADNSATGTPVPPTPVIESAPAAQPKKSSENTTKKSKKDDKGIRMVYSDNEVSPEEKMAKLAKYFFERDTSPQTGTIQTSVEDRAGVVSSGFNDYEHGPRNLTT